MYVRRKLSKRLIFRFVWPDLLWTMAYNALVFSLFFLFDIKWFDLPYEVVSTIGIAIAFLIGFKNNQAYDRYWEGRKIWGQIVNYSRMWGAQVVALVGEPAERAADPALDLHDIHRRLIYRHIAWINALRVQLRAHKAWAVRENFLVERFINRHREGKTVLEVIAPFVADEELDGLGKRKNIATHLVKNQAQDLNALRRDHGMIDGFDLLLMMETVNKSYDLQGMCERIKNTPFPRQFAYFSKLFTVLFCLIIPLGLLDIFEEELVRGVEFAQTFGTAYSAPTLSTILLMVPLSIIISSVFLTWEQVGDNSEEPFEERPFDVSMTALCRTIEIDLRDMLDEADLPPGIEPVDHVLY